jgi:hypothetical protein
MNYNPIINPIEPPPVRDGFWEKNLPDGTTLVGVKGYDSHTHIGSNFVSIRDEMTREQIIWRTDLPKPYPDGSFF